MACIVVMLQCQWRVVRASSQERALITRPVGCAQLFRAVPVVEPGAAAGLEDGSCVARTIAEHGARVGARLPLRQPGWSASAAGSRPGQRPIRASQQGAAVWRWRGVRLGLERHEQACITALVHYVHHSRSVALGMLSDAVGKYA